MLARDRELWIVVEVSFDDTVGRKPYIKGFEGWQESEEMARRALEGIAKSYGHDMRLGIAHVRLPEITVSEVTINWDPKNEQDAESA